MAILVTLMLVSVFQGAVITSAKKCPDKKPCCTFLNCRNGQPTTTTTSTTITAISSTTSTTATTTTTVSKQSDKNGQLPKNVYVSIPVIVVLVAMITGVVLYLKRQKILLPLARVIYKRNGTSHVDSPGTAITSYENVEVSSKASTTFVHTSETLGSGYEEIAIGNLQNKSDREYQTIDSLHEDQTVSANTYGHLKEQTVRFDSKTYSHMSENHADAKATTEIINHSHIGKPDHELTVSEVKTDITYNTLNTLSRLSIGRYEKDDKNTNDEETEYDHARAGKKDTFYKVKKQDEYAHLNSTVRKTYTQDRTIEWIDMNDNETEIHEINSVRYFKDSEQLIKDNSATSSYSKGVKTNTTTESPNHNLPRNDDDKVAVGPPHAYFILEPMEGPQNDKDAQFQIVENKHTEMCEVSECDDSQSHTYFILEKNCN